MMIVSKSSRLDGLHLARSGRGTTCDRRTDACMGGTVAAPLRRSGLSGSDGPEGSADEQAVVGKRAGEPSDVVAHKVFGSSILATVRRVSLSSPTMIL